MQGGRQPDGPSTDPVVAFLSVSLRLGETLRADGDASAAGAGPGSGAADRP